MVCKMLILKISLLVIILQINLFAQWFLQQSSTNVELNGVWFADSLNGWACGDSGIILNTTNGGQEWERQNSNVNVKLEDVFFWDAQKGWIVGDSGTIIHTIDGGISWNEQQTNETSLLHHIQFVSPLTGFASGEQSAALETFDGGLNWQPFSEDTGAVSVILYWIQQGLGTIAACDSLYGFHFCTVDGLNWFPVGRVLCPLDICGLRTDIPIHPRNYYWDVGIDGSAYWISIIEDLGVVEFILYGETQDTLDLNAVTLERGVEPLKLWAVGQSGWIINSVDSGLTWQTIQSGITADLYEVFFPMKNRGWAVGDSGVILRYDHPTSVNNSIPNVLPTIIQLSDAYPNPFNPSTKIKYTIPNPPVSSPLVKGRTEEGFVTLKVYDVLGNEIATLVNEEKPAGTYELTWNAVNLPSGVYFYQLKAGDFVETKKMVFLK
jgi:photosystem II stability/assembly factor-like uncharacterized protein